MATENVKVLRIDTNPAQTSVKDLRNELKELRSTMLSCEEGTEEYNNALRQAAKIQHTLKEQMEQVNATAMDFGQIASNCTKAVGGMVAGFQAATAVMNLFGVENEEVLKAMQKMQSLMALTQAFPAIDKGIKAFKALGIAIKGAAAATSTFSKALIATGIGAAIAAIGLLIANWDKLKGVIAGTNEELEKQKQIKIDEYLQSVNDKLEKQWMLEKEIRGILGQNDLEIAAANVDFYNKKLEQSNNKIALFRSQLANLYADLARNRNAGKAQSVLDGIQKKIDGINDKIKLEEESQKSLNEQIKKAGEEYDKAKIIDKARKIAQAQKDAEDAAKKAAEERKKKQEEEAKSLQKLIDKYTTLKEKLSELASTKATQDEYGSWVTMVTVFDEASKEYNRLEQEAERYKNIITSVILEVEKGTEEFKDITEADLRAIVRQYEVLYGSRITHLSTDKGILFTQLLEKQSQERLQKHEEEIQKDIAITETGYKLQLASLKKELDEELITKEQYDEKKKELTEQYVKDYIEQIQTILNTETALTQETILQLTESINNARELLNPDSGDTADGITEAINASVLALNEFSDNPAWGKVLQNLAIISANWDELHKNMKEGGTKAFSAYAQVAAAGLGAVAALMNGLANEQDKTTKEGFEEAKKYQIAGATMSMLAGIASAWASSMQLMFPANVIVGSILSTMMTVLGAVQIAKIKNTQFDGNGSSGGGYSPNTGAINSIIAPVQYTQDVQGASIEDTIKNQKVYVTETDISNTQKKVSVSESESRY